MTAVTATRTGAGRWPLWLARLLVLGVLLYLVLGWFVGGEQTFDAVRRIGGGWVAIGLGLTLVNFALRALRWHVLLRVAGARVPVLNSIAIYVGGIGLGASPGKLGETLRSVFLLRHGVRVGTSLAAFFVDRLSDLLAVLVLAACAASWARIGDTDGARWWAVVALVLVCAWLLTMLVRSGRLEKLLGNAPALGWRRRVQDWLHAAGGDYLHLWRPRLAVASVLLSLVAYALQGLIFAGMVAQVAPQVATLRAIGIFAAATLAGAASLVPGGVGPMELALVLLLAREGLDAPSALAAALSLRVVTFWFGMLLGAGGLSLAARQHQ